MPQKKTANRAKMKKPAAKRQMQNGTLALAEKVEKEFRHIPTKLAKLYRQELMAQKQQKSKLKNEIKKNQTLQKANQKKQAALMKDEPTKVNKKQLMAAKKSNAQTSKMIKILTAQLNQMAKKTNMLLIKQNKYVSLSKELAKIEKQLTIKASATINTKQPMTKKARPEKSKTIKPAQIATEAIMAEETPFMISSKTETVEM